MAIGVIVSIASLALTAYQTYAGVKAAEEAEAERLRLEKEAAVAPGFEVTPEMRLVRARAEEAAKYGFSPEERADFRQRTAGYRATAERQATDIAGGQIAPAVAFAQKGKEIEATGRMAATGDQLRQQKIRYAGETAVPFQTAADLEVQRQRAEMQRRLQYNLLTQQTAGQTMQTGISGALNVGYNAWVLDAYKKKQMPTGDGTQPLGLQGWGTGYGTQQSPLYEQYNPPYQFNPTFNQYGQNN